MHNCRLYCFDNWFDISERLNNWETTAETLKLLDYGPFLQVWIQKTIDIYDLTHKIISSSDIELEETIGAAHRLSARPDKIQP